jgi:hypothetical protein
MGTVSITSVMIGVLFIVFGFFPASCTTLPAISALQIGNTIWESLLHFAADTPLLHRGLANHLFDEPERSSESEKGYERT